MTALVSGDAEVALNVLENAVAEAASFFDVAGAEGEAQAFCRSIRTVDCYMTPPNTAVVPQVVVQVVIIDTKRDFCLWCRHSRNMF